MTETKYVYVATYRGRRAHQLQVGDVLLPRDQPVEVSHSVFLELDSREDVETERIAREDPSADTVPPAPSVGTDTTKEVK